VSWQAGNREPYDAARGRGGNAASSNSAYHFAHSAENFGLAIVPRFVKMREPTTVPLRPNVSAGVAVTLRDGGHLLIVGRQVPRDEAANVVGRGDMRTQIEQGKNVGACLKAGGATFTTLSLRLAPSRRLPTSRSTPICCRAISPPNSTTVRAPHLPAQTFCCKSGIVHNERLYQVLEVGSCHDSSSDELSRLNTKKEIRKGNV
jgi:hypothetical protein